MTVMTPERGAGTARSGERGGPRVDGVVARKRFGQHFLADRGVIQSIVSAIAPRPGDRMVEIGPGTGVLTAPLMQALGHLDAIELDRDLADRLEQRWGEGLTLHRGDVLQFDWQGLCAPEPRLRIVGNLPYNISSPLLLSLIRFAPRVADQHFMLQKEVIDRVAAQPGSSFGRLSVMLQAFYDIQALFDVPPEAFRPPPRVMSSVMRMIPLERPRVQAADVLEQLLAVSFQQRRKMLRNSLGRWVAEQWPQFDWAEANRALPVLDPFGQLECRPESVPVLAWCALADRLASLPRVQVAGNV